MRTHEEHAKRLESLMIRYPHIDREAHLKDLELCKAYLAGDCVKFEIMFQTAYKKMEKYVYLDSHGTRCGVHINTQDKEDIIADAAGTALSHVEKFHGWSLYSTWMRGIARYRILQMIHRRCKESATEPLDDAKAVHADYSQNSDVAVWEILSGLPESDATIVRLRAIEQLSFGEIAQQLSVSIDNVRRRYLNAIKTLKVLLR